MYDKLVSAENLAKNLHNQNWYVFECHSNTNSFNHESHEGLIRGAHFFDLQTDLSGDCIAGKTGRHTLPEPETLISRLQHIGVLNNSQIVVYDRGDNAIATRAWWIMRWLGHKSVAVLDGGWKGWVDKGGEIETENDNDDFMYNLSGFTKKESLVQVIDNSDAGSGKWLLIDSRSVDRFQGKKDWTDPISGHIPGAINAPFLDNLSDDNNFLEAEKLKKLYSDLIPADDTRPIACYCGSGVTATHSILALEIAGYTNVALYPGSWSEWIMNPSNPIARGGQHRK